MTDNYSVRVYDALLCLETCVLNMRSMEGADVRVKSVSQKGQLAESCLAQRWHPILFSKRLLLIISEEKFVQLIDTLICSSKDHLRSITIPGYILSVSIGHALEVLL